MRRRQVHTVSRMSLLAILLIFGVLVAQARQGNQDSVVMLPVVLDSTQGDGPQAPVARDDAYAAEAGKALAVGASTGVLANDTGQTGQTLTAALVSDVAHGTLALNPDGSFTYTAGTGYAGQDTFTYRAMAGGLASEPATVRLTVREGNQPPVAVADAYQVERDSELVVNAAGGVLANDTDPDGDALQAALATDVANGTLALNPDGSFVYTPPAGFAGEDSFTYTAGDGIATSAPGTVTITVIAAPPVNAPPRFQSGTLGFTHTVIGKGVLGTHIALGADLDNDGDMDVVATDYDNGRVLWYENDGQGNFAEHLLDNLEGAYPAAVGDVDLDGDDDVLAAGYLADTFVWYRNDGGGNFTRINIDTDSDGAHSIIPVDLDGDGDIDLVTSSQDAGTIAWYENDGANNFTRHIIDDNTLDAKRAEVGDIDGDGDLDIVTAGYKRDEIAWLENDGNQNFTKHVISNEADGAYYAYAADLNGDGHMDILSASKLDGTIAWYQNDGNQNFTYKTLSTKSPGARTVIAVDLDGDGDLDPLSTSLNDHTVAWYENDAQGNFTKRIISNNVRGAYGVYAVDMDFDGRLDVLSAARNSNEVALHTPYRVHTARVPQGGTLAINATRLKATDADNGPAELTYTMTAAPTRGQLRLGGAALSVGSTFTQADVDAGLLAYVHTAADKVDDAFTLTVTDGEATLMSVFRMDIR